GAAKLTINAAATRYFFIGFSLGVVSEVSSVVNCDKKPRRHAWRSPGFLREVKIDRLMGGAKPITPKASPRYASYQCQGTYEPVHMKSPGQVTGTSWTYA